MAKKRLPGGIVQFEGAAFQKGKSTSGPGTNQSLNRKPIVSRDPAGVRRSGNDPRGKVAHEVPTRRRGRRG